MVDSVEKKSENAFSYLAQEEKQQKLKERMVNIDFVPSVPSSITTNGLARELSGFTSGADYDRAISYSLKRQKYYDILLQSQYDEIVSINKELSEIDPKYDLLDLIPKKQQELDALMQEGLALKAEKKDEERYCEAVREARKQYMSNFREQKKAAIESKFHKGDTVFDRLESAKNEFKELENKVYRETADRLEKERYNDLKDFVIPDLEKQIAANGMVDWSKSKIDKEKVQEEKQDVEPVLEKVEYDENNSSDPFNIGTKSEEKQKNEEEPKPVLENEPVVQPVAEPVPEVVKPSVEAPNLNDIYVDGMELGIIRKAVKAIANIPEMLKAKINNRKAFKSTEVSDYTAVIEPEDFEEINAKPIRNPQSVTREDITAPVDVKKYAVSNSVASVPEVVSDENIDVNKPWESVSVEEMSSKLEGYRR